MSVGQIVDNPKTNNASPIRILAIDDHQLIRVGIATLIAPESDMTLVGEAVNGIEGIAKYRECLPDVTLMDLRMPDMEGIDAIIAIRSEYPEARIIVLTTYTGDVQAFRAMQAGAQAYVTKNLVHQELLQTIRAVHAGRRAMSPEVAAEVAAYAGVQTLTV
jgi:DNA-binding NarL/FixJ family response regulator